MVEKEGERERRLTRERTGENFTKAPPPNTLCRDYCLPSQVIFMFERFSFSSDLLARSPSFSMKSPLSPQRLKETLRSLNDFVHGYQEETELCVTFDHRNWA